MANDSSRPVLRPVQRVGWAPAPGQQINGVFSCPLSPTSPVVAPLALSDPRTHNHDDVVCTGVGKAVGDKGQENTGEIEKFELEGKRMEVTEDRDWGLGVRENGFWRLKGWNKSEWKEEKRRRKVSG